MKKILIIGCILFAASNNNCKAQTQEETQNWMNYMTPSDKQKMMASWDGEWTEEITMWSPGMPEQKMQGNCTNKMILGGRYQEARYTGNMMGMAFEGIGTTGWDNLRKIFVSSWIDNMGTGMVYMEGGWDEATKTSTMTGKMTDPATGKASNIKQVLKIIDENTQEMTQYGEKDGKEYKSMLIVLKRKK